MFVDFVLGWGANFVGIVKGGRVSKSLRTSAIDYLQIFQTGYFFTKKQIALIFNNTTIMPLVYFARFASII